MWTAIISGIVAVVKAVTVWMGKRRDEMLIALGRSGQRSDDLQGRIDALQEANRLREAARASVARDDSGGVPVDDGFQRKDD
jgi:hypothetical protein